VEGALVDALADTRVVIVNGARQSGKSTAVHHLVRNLANTIERRLDRPNDLAAARHDPTEFVAHNGLLVIDEIQRAPELILPIKARVDVDGRPGQFLLTGSARLLGLRTLPDALVGRSETIELWPFSQGEIDGKPDRCIDAAFKTEPTLRTSAQLDRSDYIERAVRGGFPEAVGRVGMRRSRFFESYVRDLIDRDVTQLGDIQRRDDLARLLVILADRAGPGVMRRVPGCSSRTSSSARSCDSCLGRTRLHVCTTTERGTVRRSMP
jgi:predicted AAA+ superfamily ATPase